MFLFFSLSQRPAGDPRDRGHHHRLDAPDQRHPEDGLVHAPAGGAEPEPVRGTQVLGGEEQEPGQHLRPAQGQDRAQDDGDSEGGGQQLLHSLQEDLQRHRGW